MSEKRECYLKIVRLHEGNTDPAYLLSRDLFGTHNKMVSLCELNDPGWKPDMEYQHLKLIAVVWCYTPKDFEVEKVSRLFPDLDHIRLCK